MNVVTTGGTANITTQFAPTVNSMSASRTAGTTDVVFIPSVADDGTVVGFFWEYINGSGPTFNATEEIKQNPTMTNYNPNAGGDVRLTITDNDGLWTAVEFPLPVFPDDVIVKNYDFESGTTQGWTASGSWHVTNFKAAGGTRSMWFGDEATQDVGSDPNATGTVESPSIDLGATPFLEFDVRNENGCIFDPCGSNKLDVHVSDDGGESWYLVAGDTDLQTGMINPFENRRYDLAYICLNEFCTITADVSNSTVLVRFTYNRASGGSYDGAFLDNIMLNNK